MRCNCGAELPPDARFCHRCGKPQRDEDIPPPELPVAAVIAADDPGAQAQPTAGAPSLLDVSFSNPVALRIALMVGILVLFLTFLAGQIGGQSDIIFLILLGVAGAASVRLYRRRTGVELSIVNGARLGWFTGFFGFLILTVLLTILAVALNDPAMVTALREQVKAHGLSEADMARFLEIFSAPGKMLTTLAISFVMFTLLPACGGALSARLMRHRPTPN